MLCSPGCRTRPSHHYNASSTLPWDSCTACVHVTMFQPRRLSSIGCQLRHVYSSSCASWSTSPSSATPWHTSQIFCNRSPQSHPVELFFVRPEGRTFKFRELAWSLESAPSASQLQSRGTICHCTSALLTIPTLLSGDWKLFYSAHFMINHSQLLLCNVLCTV